MATNFPSSVDSFTNPTTSDTLASVSHSAQHSDVNDAVEAIETALLDGAPLHIDDVNERVGIGTTAPSQELDVNGDIVVPVGNGFMFDRVGSDSHILYKETPGGSTYGSPDDVVLRNPNNASLRFQTGGTNNRVTVDSSGNVGIGDTTPSYKLDVNGDINLTGDLRYAGTVHKRVVFGGSATVNVAKGADTAWVKYVDITPTAPFTGYMYIQFMGNTGFNYVGKETTVGWGDTSAGYGNVYHNFRTYPTAAHWNGVALHYLYGVTSGVNANAAIWISHDSAGGTTYLRGTYKYWWIET